MKYLTIFSLSLITPAMALDVEEKLTVRFLKISSSKKTVIVNRGVEDGLATGDHGKFFLTPGVIARGMVAKTSPTRSVWSLYQIIDSGQVVVDKVVSVKIITPLKISKDKSKSIAKEEGVMDMGLTDEERLEMASMDGTIGESNLNDDLFEFWAMVHINNFSVDGSDGEENTSGKKVADMALSVGGEKYFSSDGGFLKNISIFLFYHHLDSGIGTPKGDTLGNMAQEVGVGLNYHFLSPPQSTNRAIGFIQGAGGTGLVKDMINNTQYKGSSRFFSLGMGLKFFLSNGMGFRATGDYYYRLGNYSLAGSNTTLRKNLRGTRIMLGLAYRF